MSVTITTTTYSTHSSPTVKREVDLSDEADGTDNRLLMEWEIPYLRTDPGSCSVAAPHPLDLADVDKPATLFVRKHQHAGQPLGHLYTRCFRHETAYRTALHNLHEGPHSAGFHAADWAQVSA